MRSPVYTRTTLIAMLLCSLVVLGAAGGTAFAGNAWLDANGIRTDNVRLNNQLVSNTTYWIDPPFLSAKVPPNVLFVLDNSGSMNDEAYASSFNPSQFKSGNYFGYFEPESCYQYSSSKWNIIGTANPTTGCAAFAGVATASSPVMHANVLNWATMRRVDAAKKLLIGGKANPRSQASCCVKLTGEAAPTSWDFSKNFDNSALSGLVYPFVGNYRYSMSSNNLSVSPLVSGTTTTNLWPIANISVPASWSVVPGTTAAWDAVDDVTPNGDTNRIENKSAANAPALFDYNYSGAGIGAISSVQVIMEAKKASSGTMRIQGVVRVAGTEYAASYSNLGTDYATYTFTWNTNPNTGAAWAWSDIKSSGVGSMSAFGVQAYTTPNSSQYPVITQIYLKINTSTPSGGPWGIVVDTNRNDVKGIMDELSNDARFGLAFYNTDGSGYESGVVNRKDGGRIDTDIDFGTPTSMITSIGNMSPSTWTPLAETLYEMVGYFRQDAPYYTTNSPADYRVGQAYDPYYYRYSGLAGSGLADQYVECAKSFILMLTDGESTQDRAIPAWLRDYDQDSNDPLPDARYPSNGSDYLDDVALWARTVDHRSTLDGNQNVILYSVFMFGSGSRLLMDAAINGGFDDLDGDNKPGCKKTTPTQQDLKECYRDSNGNGTIDPYSAATNTGGDLPLTYFQGDDGYDLYVSIIDAITAILKRAASGTSVSVLGSSWKGEGSMYQAYFYPEKVEGLRRVKWTGYFHSLFVDRNAMIREDTNRDGKLIPNDDHVLVFDAVEGQDTLVKYYWDKVNNDTGEPYPDGKLDSSVPVRTATLSDISPLWDAGKPLAKRAASDRVIYTSINADTATPPGLIDFHESNAAALRPYLRAKTSTGEVNAKNLINFIRGEAITGWRDRQLTVDGTLHTWKLSDIVFSDPTVVGAPRERFDLIYNDQGYADFYQKWKKRRAVVYVGGNGGMLHAFNAGYFISTEVQIPDSTTAQIVFCEKLDATDPTQCDPGGDPANYLGKELWGFVPFDLLPHLAWLADPDYQHTYYVDSMVRVTDARIFPPSEDHRNGWGTILIIGMRFGGGEIDVTDTFGASTIKQFKSAYYALDVTNPDLPPKLLWRFTDPELGFTLSVPAIVREEVSGVDYWYAAFGSGPTNYRGGKAVDTTTTNTKFTKAGVVAGITGQTYINAHLYIIDLALGQAHPGWTTQPSSGRRGVFRGGAVPAFFTNITSVDYPQDFKYDKLYFGTVWCSSGCSADGFGTWSGSVGRIHTYGSVNTGSWNWSNLFVSNQPITVKPAVGLDDRGNVWVYFGTGRFLHVDDRFDATAEHYYGIKDKCYHANCGTAVTNGANILNSNNYAVQADGSLLPPLAAGAFSSGSPSAAISRFADLRDYMRDYGEGWKIALQAGERITVNGFVIGGISGFGSFKPSQTVCEFRGRSRMYFPYYLTGTASYNPSGTFISGVSVDLGSGMPSLPAFHIDSKGKTTVLIQDASGSVRRLEVEQAEPLTGGLGPSAETDCP